MSHLAGTRFTSQWQQSNQQCLTWQVLVSLVGVTLAMSWKSSAGSSILSRLSISSSLRCSSSVGQNPSQSRLSTDNWRWSSPGCCSTQNTQSALPPLTPACLIQFLSDSRTPPGSSGYVYGPMKFMYTFCIMFRLAEQLFTCKLGGRKPTHQLGQIAHPLQAPAAM